MKGFLNHSQIEYVLYHLGQHIHLHEAIKDSMVFIKSGDELPLFSNKIVFHLSEKDFSISDVMWINELPVLFPLSEKESFFHINNNNIFFTHDLLKSSFYLLTGFQEKDNDTFDSLGRFPYSSSVQAKLNFIQKPVVNYYFKEMIEGIKKHCLLQNIEFKRKSPFNGFAFFLTHDVDRIKYFTFNSLLYTIKLIFQSGKNGKSRLNLVKEIFRIGFHILNIFDKSDPYWNFKNLTDQEKDLGINSTYFFLPKDQKHIDSYYYLGDRKIRELISFLQREGNEVGLHGTVRSSSSDTNLKKILSEFISVTNITRPGIRQHRLMWQHPHTARFHENEGISYDTSLGFADHEGFRNSYCHPFKLYDFENDRMLSYWEIPLIVMDSTLFHNRRLTIKTSMDAVITILGETIKFNGVFTLLWHNSYFNESDLPGITDFYYNLLEMIIAEKPEILTGLSIVKKCNDNCTDE